MCDSIDQSTPRSRSAQLCLSFWQLEGGGKAATCATASRIWEDAARAGLDPIYRDGRGLPRPGVARVLTRLAVDKARWGQARTVRVALRYAGMMAKRHPLQPIREEAVPAQGLGQGTKMFASEIEEVRLAWEHLLREGACTILANGAGNLRPGALRALARRLKSVRQGRLFHPRESAETMIRDLAAAAGRARRPVRA